MAAENPNIPIVEAYLAAVAALPAQSEHPVPHPFTIDWKKSFSKEFVTFPANPESTFSWGPSIPIPPPVLPIPVVPKVPQQFQDQPKWVKSEHKYNMVVNGFKYDTSQKGHLIRGRVSITGIKYTTDFRIDPVGTVFIKDATGQVIHSVDKHIVITRVGKDEPLFEGIVHAETFTNHGQSVYMTVVISPTVTLYLQQYQHAGCFSFEIYGMNLRDTQ